MPCRDIVRFLRDFPPHTVKEHTMSRNTEYVTTMETQLKQWDAQVDALAAKSAKANADARAAYDGQIKDLRASRDAAQKQFQQIRTANETAGAQLQAGMDAAWQTMQKNLAKVSTAFTK
jgi:hypothetical protein